MECNQLISALTDRPLKQGEYLEVSKYSSGVISKIARHICDTSGVSGAPSMHWNYLFLDNGSCLGHSDSLPKGLLAYGEKPYTSTVKLKGAASLLTLPLCTLLDIMDTEDIITLVNNHKEYSL